MKFFEIIFLKPLHLLSGYFEIFRFFCFKIFFTLGLIPKADSFADNFIGFSNLKHDNQKISDHSMITEINGYRTKKVLENYKANFFSPYMGNDVIEINSIISKYLASATFDAKNTRLIDLLFNRIHTIKAHSLTDDILKTSFRELESYFQDKNETLIGIIDYEFNKQQNRRINNISINPDQKKEIILDKGDRLITIANFNNLEMVNNSQWLHIL